MMDDIERLVIEQACRRLVLDFARYNDDLDHARLADLFVDDCIFARPLDPQYPYHGRAAVHAIFRDRAPRLTRHVMTNIRIQVDSHDRAHGNSYVTMISSPNADRSAPREGEGIFFGAFDDVFVRTTAGWKFKERHGSVALYQGGPLPILPVPTDAQRGIGA